MWLDELNDLVVELSTKIDQHREILRKSESATRYGLIDPLLTALGWDLSDPAQVLTEYNSGHGRADYAMAPGSGPPSLVVEAKSLHTPTAQGIAQSINYCLQDGIKYFVITNGNDWEVYETHRPVPMQDKRVTAFKITDMNQSAVMGMLWLWRGNFKDGDPAMPAPPPTKEPTDTGPPDKGGDTGPEDIQDLGVPLSELNPPTGEKAPRHIRFPDGFTRSLGYWNRIQIATVEWLIETGKLNEASCPVTDPSGNYLVHTSAYKNSGKPFTSRRQIRQYWIDVGCYARDHASRAREMLNAADVDPSKVSVSF